MRLLNEYINRLRDKHWKKGTYLQPVYFNELLALKRAYEGNL